MLQSQFYPLKINITLTFFTYSWAELNVVYVLKKSRPKSQFLTLKSLLEPSVLIWPEILILPPTFQMLASGVVGLCATVEILRERPGGALTRYGTDDRSEL